MSEECMGSDRSEEMLNTVGPVGCVCVHTKMCVQMGAGNHSVGMRKAPVCVNLREDVFHALQVLQRSTRTTQMSEQSVSSKPLRPGDPGVKIR